MDNWSQYPPTVTIKRKSSTVFLATVLMAPLLLIGAYAHDNDRGADQQPLFSNQDAGDNAQFTTGFVKHALRRRTATIATPTLGYENLANADSLLINLFDDVEVVATQIGSEQRNGRDHSWFGAIEDDPTGHVIVSISRGRAALSVDYRGRSYIALPIPYDRYEILELDHKSFPNGDDSPPPSKLSTRSSGDSQSTELFTDLLRDYTENKPIGDLKRRFEEYKPSPVELRGPVFHEIFDGPQLRWDDDGSEIDIIVLYTPLAREAIEFDTWLTFDLYDTFLSVIQLAIDQANWSFLAEGMQTRLNLVTEPISIPYLESGSMTVDRDALQIYGDGVMDAAHFYRNLYAADIVTLITTGGISDETGDDLCGISFMKLFTETLEENSTKGFNVVKADCLAAKTFVHEYGHNLGAHHDNFVIQNSVSEPGVQTHARGYILPPELGEPAGRTIMAYTDQCEHDGYDCPVMIFWSNPDAGINGRKVGIAAGSSGAADNHDVITTKRPNSEFSNLYEVANYRPSICRMLSTC